ncbi:MAG: hypothetical protein ACI97A_000982 [Planctomycetota bacterium]|jgi:hypothetical protein
MRLLSSRTTRIFLICWVVFAAHFATNVVREHYPAFSLLEDGDLKLDEYADFHADIFKHTDGHYYIGNQITGSLPAIPMLAVFDPLLDHLEEKRLREIATSGIPSVDYDSEYKNRRAFMAKVKARGLDLRFAGATVITSFFCMAPICALFVAFFFMVLRKRGVEEKRATALAFLFAFATPIFYRSAYLNHNVFLMITVFLTFWLIWSDEEDQRTATWRRIGAGFCAGASIALDYAGVVPLLVFYGYLIIVRWNVIGFVKSWRESLAYVIGSVPPVVFLCWTQWIMYGHPFLPGQKHMPAVTFTERGYVGFDWPNWDVFSGNLFSPNYGLITFAPILALSFLPVLGKRVQSLITPTPQRYGVHAFIIAFFIFCAGNQYSLMQFNTGFRYLLPMVPFLFLMAAEHLRAIPTKWLWVIGAPCVLHTWVLSMVRYTKLDLNEGAQTIAECWRRFLSEGFQLPSINVLRQISPDPNHFSHWLVWPYVAFFLMFAISIGIWKLGERGSAHSVTNGTGKHPNT